MEKKFSCRTYFPLLVNAYSSTFKYTFYANQLVEIVVIKGGYDSGGGSLNASFDETCYNCKKLRKVLFGNNGAGIANSNLTETSFRGCTELEEISTISVHAGQRLNLSDSAKFRISCVEKIVDVSKVATEGKPSTITLHPDVYAQCTEELLAAAAAKNIIISTTE